MSKKLSELLLDDSFVRFLQDNASEDEEAQWTAWMQEEQEHAQLVERGRKLLNEGFETLPKPDSDSELQRLMARIDSERQYKQPLYAVRDRNKKAVWATMAVAASILLIVGFMARHIFLQNGGTEDSRATSIVYKTMTTDYGERTSIRYSDGSKIVINGHSEMRLPKMVGGQDTVEVWLKGEALFDITRKPDSQARKFIVHTSNSDISVLGTRFAVNTIEKQTRVVLAEGSVLINNRDATKKGDTEYKMVPGELALLSPDADQIQVSKVNPEVYLSWANDSLILDKTPFSEVVQRIERTYGVKMVVKNEQLLQQKLTGQLKSIDLDILLEGLSKTLNVNIKKKGKTIYVKNDSCTK